MKIAIRPVADEDYEQISSIYSFRSVIEQTTQLPHRDALFWKSFYSSQGTDYLELVAVCDGTVVGHLGILLNKSPRRKHAASFGVVVHPDHQGQGVGRALLDELIDLADNWLNLFKIELSVFADNDVAVGLYQKLGFVIEGESKFDTFKNGKLCHVFNMARFNTHSSHAPDR